MKITVTPRMIMMIQQLERSSAKDFFESKERYFLKTIRLRLQNLDDFTLSDDEINMLDKILRKYEKFL